MIWITVGATGALLLAVLWWWLSRPLWYDCQGVQNLENFLRDLMSPRSPWPQMVVVSRSGGPELIFQREYVPREGVFELSLHLVALDADAEKVRSFPEAVKARGFSGDEVELDLGSDAVTVRVDFGGVTESTLAEAAQVTRILLSHLDLDAESRLRVRYGGTMDPKVAGPSLEKVRPPARMSSRKDG